MKGLPGAWSAAARAVCPVCHLVADVASLASGQLMFEVCHHDHQGRACGGVGLYVPRHVVRYSGAMAAATLPDGRDITVEVSPAASGAGFTYTLRGPGGEQSGHLGGDVATVASLLASVVEYALRAGGAR